jgi:hypothetical protein
MSERKSSRRKKIERPVQNLVPENHFPSAAKKPEEKRTVYPTTSVSIVWDSLNTKRKISDSFRNEMIEYYYTVQKKPDSLYQELASKMEDYPDIQIFYSYLFTAYHLEEQNDKAIEIANLGAKKFSDSIVGKTLFVEAALLKNDLDGIASYLDEKYDYRSLFPEKGIYHIFEIIHFNYAIGKFLAQSGDKEGAERCMAEIKSIDPEHVFIKHLQKVMDKSSGVKFYQKILRRFKKSK